MKKFKKNTFNVLKNVRSKFEAEVAPPEAAPPEETKLPSSKFVAKIVEEVDEAAGDGVDKFDVDAS